MEKNNKKGFTLAEVLIYTAIFAIVAGLTTGILLTITQVNQRESASAEVTGQLNFLMQRFQQIISDSSNIDITAGVSTSTLKLRMEDTTKDPTCISLVSGVVKLAEGPGSNPNNCTTVTSDLTNDRVVINTLNFKKFSQYPGHDTVSVDITMTYNSANPKSQIQRTLSSAIARVSAATFDSALLPGSDNSYDVGYSPSTRWRNGAFSGNLLVSGNVGIGTTNPGAKLDVVDGRLRVKVRNSEVLRLWDPVTTWAAQMALQGNDSVGNPTTYAALQGGVVSSTDSAESGKLDFQIADAGSIGTKMTILNTGNVGIGTMTPNLFGGTVGTYLTIAGTGSTYQQEGRLELANPKATAAANDYAGSMYFTSANNSGDKRTAMLSAALVGNGGANGFGGKLTFSTKQDNSASYNSMVMDQFGNVGIGTTTPEATLDVNGTVKATNFSNLANSFVRITAQAIVGSSAASHWYGNASCPSGYTIVFWGTTESVQYWGGGMTHWYGYCYLNGNGIQADLYTANGYAGHWLKCMGLCAKN